MTAVVFLNFLIFISLLVLILNWKLFTKSRQTQFFCLKLLPNWQQRWNANKCVEEDCDKQLLSWSWHFWETLSLVWLLTDRAVSVLAWFQQGKIGESFPVGKISSPNMQGFVIYKKRVWWNHFGILIFILKKLLWTGITTSYLHVCLSEEVLLRRPPPLSVSLPEGRIPLETMNNFWIPSCIRSVACFLQTHYVYVLSTKPRF